MNVDEILKATGGILLNEKTNKIINHFKVDTRKLKAKDGFIALKTENRDGHDFIEEAIRKKASVIIVSENVNIHTKIPIIKVKDTHECLFDLAQFMKEKYPIFSIAVTGSSGKTTTKELLYEVLKEEYFVLKNEGNYNNHIGVPLTLLNLNQKYDILLTEMGMNHKGEISKLSKLVKPDIGIITNIGTSHIGNLGSIRKIKKAKLEVLDGMEDGVLFVNNQNKYLKYIQNDRVIKVPSSDIKIESIKGNLEKTEFIFTYQNHKYNIHFHGPQYLISNILLVLEVGLLLDIPILKIIETIENYQMYNHRMNIMKGKNILIDDCYNASFESLSSALELLKKEEKDKIIILGDMLELGKYSKKYHKKINKILKKIQNKKVLLRGEHTKYICGKHFSSNQELIEYLKNINIKDTIIFIKGSRKIKLEEIVNYLNTYFV